MEPTPLKRIASDFAANPIALFGLTLLGIIVLAALLAPLISPQNPYDLAQLDVVEGRLPPGSPSPAGGRFWLGTDDQGRDMLSAIFYGLRISLTVGIVSTVIALVIGLALGLAAAYFGGATDSLIMRVADIQLSFPAILIALIRLQSSDRNVEDHRRAGHGAMGLLRADGKERGAGRAAKGIHRRGALPRAVALAYRLSSSVAELPAASHGGGDRPGRRRDRARGDPVFPGPGSAYHRAFAGTPHRQRLSVSSLGQVLDQLLSRHRFAPDHREHQSRGRSVA
jgi:hypothetical protein